MATTLGYHPTQSDLVARIASFGYSIHHDSGCRVSVVEGDAGVITITIRPRKTGTLGNVTVTGRPGARSVDTPKRYEPEVGDEYWYLVNDRSANPLTLDRDILKHWGIRSATWRDSGDDYMHLYLGGRVFRTRDEAKAELFKRQAEGK